MEPTTILVILGAIFLFISLIGGGFKIKEIEMPHVNFLRRLMLFLFGLTLILAGFGLLPKIAQSLKTSFTETKVKTPLKTSKKPKIEIRSEKPEYTPPKPRVPEPTVYDPRSASITTDDKFLICRDIINRNPSGVSDRFDYGQVYVQAEVFALRREKLKLEWYDPNGNVIRKRHITIERNMGDGYRIYDYKLFDRGSEGEYEVRLFNEQGGLIGQKKFSIVPNLPLSYH